MLPALHKCKQSANNFQLAHSSYHNTSAFIGMNSFVNAGQNLQMSGHHSKIFPRQSTPFWRELLATLTSLPFPVQVEQVRMEDTTTWRREL